MNIATPGSGGIFGEPTVHGEVAHAPKAPLPPVPTPPPGFQPPEWPSAATEDADAGSSAVRS